MANDEIKNASKGKSNLTTEIATRSVDVAFYSALEVLPNPDRILRRMGKSYEVFDDIIGDAHVLGELRSIRSGLLGYETKIMPGGDSPQDIHAFELCEKIMRQKPAPLMDWTDTTWNMGCATFFGYSVHEIVWKHEGNYLVPDKVVDKAQKSFLFDLKNNLRLRTRTNPIKGEELGDYKWLITNHMVSNQNPYGVAVFSACFWPYVFKHGGMKFFSKFCEKYGIPWAIGKYPQGTPESVIKDLVTKLSEMVEDGVAAIPDAGQIELLEHQTRGQPIQSMLIDLCNREMSKALTSQTLSTEIQGQGSRAASETHREKETSVNQSDRTMVERTYNQLFAWITELNVAGALPPTFHFFEEAQARKEMAAFLKESNELVDLKKDEVYDRLQLTKPEDGDDIVSRGSITKPSIENEPSNFGLHDCPTCRTHYFAKDNVLSLSTQAADLADNIISSLPDVVYKKLIEFEKAGKTLIEFQEILPELLPEMDEHRIADIFSLASQAGYLSGMDETE